MAIQEHVGDGIADLDRPRLVVVCGLPGVGKTTVAGAIADRIDGELIRTDIVRKNIRSTPAYTDDETRAVYRRVFSIAGTRIERGENVVLDGTFRRAELRDQAEALAEEWEAVFDLVKVECTEDIVKERIENRTDDASDADFEVYQTLRERFEPIRTEHVAVDNSGMPEDASTQIESYL